MAAICHGSTLETKLYTCMLLCNAVACKQMPASNLAHSTRPTRYEAVKSKKINKLLVREYFFRGHPQSRLGLAKMGEGMQGPGMLVGWHAELSNIHPLHCQSTPRAGKGARYIDDF